MFPCKDINLKDKPMPFSQNRQRVLIFRVSYIRQNLFFSQEVGTHFPLLCVILMSCLTPHPSPPTPFPLRPRSLCSGAAESREAESVKGPGERERERELL